MKMQLSTTFIDQVRDVMETHSDSIEYQFLGIELIRELSLYETSPKVRHISLWQRYTPSIIIDFLDLLGYRANPKSAMYNFIAWRI